MFDDFDFEAGWTPSDELDCEDYEDEYADNHCYPQEW